MSAIYSCAYGRVFKLFCCFSCPSTSPSQEIILALTHRKAFHHQANRCGEYWSHPDTELEKLLAKSFTVGGNSEKWGVSVFGGVQDLLHSQGKPALVLDVGHEIPRPLLLALLGLSAAPFCLCSPLGSSLPWV